MNIISRSKRLLVPIAAVAISVVVSACTPAQIREVERQAAAPKVQIGTAISVLPGEQPVDPAVVAFLQFANVLHNEPFLVCTRAHESDTAGGYTTNTGNGYYGAYQYKQGTWDYAAAHYGAPQYVGWRASDVPGFWQDVVTWNFYLAGGNGPWGGRC